MTITQVLDRPTQEQAIARYITTAEATTAPHTMVVHVQVSQGQSNQVVDLCIPNDGKRCRPKINEAIARYLPGWTVQDWRDISSAF